MAANRRLRMKNKQLLSFLQEMDTLESAGYPRHVWDMEQYPTPPDLASELLINLELVERAIEGRTVVDLGCGSGILGLGCLLLGAERVTAIDIDPNCVKLTQSNANDLGISSDQLSVIQYDIKTIDTDQFDRADTVIMNPPFGTKDQEGIDRIFVEKGLGMATNVYSLHKSSTVAYWRKAAANELHCNINIISEIQFPIERLIKYHKHNRKDISVHVIKFSH